jgi:subtilase family serine protease
MKAIARARAARAGSSRARLLGLLAVTSLSMLAGNALAAMSAGGGAPPIIRHSTDLGPVAASNTIQLTFWLKMRNAQGLDETLAAQHAGHAEYLTSAQIDAQYSPKAADVATVIRFLKSQGFEVTGVGPHNMFVKVSGTVAQAQRTLQVELHQYRLKDMTFRASAVGARVPAEIAPMVAAVGGLSDLRPQPDVMRAGKLKQAQPTIIRQTDAEGMPPSPHLLGASPNGLVYSNQCFNGQTTVNLTGPGVTATYQGNRYGQSVTNTAPGTVAPCGYQPSDVQNAYNLTQLYHEGLDGRGMTIAIVDAFGSTTIQQDADAFSYYMGLPPPNLMVIGTPTESNYSTDANAGWATETTLDVEWVHAIAPRAKIILVVTPTNEFSDLFAGDITASEQPGVSAISNSWGGPEAGLDPSFQQAADAVFKAIGATGASLDYSSGDSGDDADELGFVDVNWPASSNYVTALGGISMALDQRGNIRFQSPWGTNLTQIANPTSEGSTPLDPPANGGLLGGGGGGGVSDVYPVPYFQRGLGASRREVPDISWIADPYTGVEIIYTADSAGDLGIEVIGGTSVAAPLFSGLWGIATQNAGHPLGQAAPYLYELPGDAITDVLPAQSSEDNVTGTIDDSSGSSFYNSWYLSFPLYGQQTFLSALYDSPFSTKWWVITFGVDSSLKAGPGYDLATGLGVPNPVPFVDSFGHRH